MPKNGTGLVHLYTGDGKGKTSAALGLALRAIGQGLSVYMIQFAKATDAPSGELAAAERLSPELEIARFGDSSVWGALAPKRDLTDDAKRATLEAFNRARSVVMAGGRNVVILDEVAIAVDRGLLGEDDLLKLICEKPAGVELILTGRGASQELVDACDLVTEMVEVRHPARRGVGARRGIEY